MIYKHSDSLTFDRLPDRCLSPIGRKIICNIVGDAIRKQVATEINHPGFSPVHLRLMNEVSSLTVVDCRDEFV